jgi:hypothetical protein
MSIKVPINQLPNGSPLTGTEAVAVVQNAVTVQVPASYFAQTGPFTSLGNYANDTAAAAGGVQIGYLYRNGSVVQVRVT